MNLRAIIRKTKAKIAEYKHLDEENINPAFFNVENACLLAVNEKRIWVLRNDQELNLVTGIKNVYQNEGNTTLESKLARNEQIIAADRYAHPSLAMPEGKYDGSVYYAGWLAQRSDHLEIFLQSGRYHNDSLNEFERLCMELYIAIQLIKCYGNYPVLFHDWSAEDTADFSLKGFLKNYPLTLSHKRRVYTVELIRQVDKLDQQNRIVQKNLVLLFSQQNFFDLMINIDIHKSFCRVHTQLYMKTQYQALKEKIDAKLSTSSGDHIDLVHFLREYGLISYQNLNKRQKVAKVMSCGLWKIERPAWRHYKEFIKALHALPLQLQTLLTTPASLMREELFKVPEKPQNHHAIGSRSLR